MNLKYFRAQTAVELAIFGAVLMFIIGIMVRQAHTSNLAQNQAYRAMRLALTKSYLSSEAGSPARNVGSVLIIEDRLSPSSDKYGPLSRFPVIISGTGSHTREFFQPPTFGIDSELPRVDLYINGQFFPLTIAAYRTYNGLDQPPGCWPGNCTTEWDPQCAYRTVNSVNQYVGCRLFYRIVPNYMADEDKNEFCCADNNVNIGPPLDPKLSCTSALKRICDPSKNLGANARFDLDRWQSGVPVPGPASQGNPTRNYFGWQWYLVKGFDPNRSSETPPYSTSYGDFLVVYNNDDEVSKNKNTVLDVDRDFKEEVTLKASYNSSGVVTQVKVIDQQKGDLDLTHNAVSSGPKPGLLDDLQMFSFSKGGPGGTRLVLLEYDGAGGQNRYTRSTQKRNRLDMIQRVLQLSNNTNRFCDSSGEPTNDVDGSPNPVEYCVSGQGADTCFNFGREDKTCMDLTTNVIYVRSRLKDIGGRRWVTEHFPIK